VTSRLWAAVWCAAARATAAVGLLCAVVTWGVWGPLVSGTALTVPTFGICVAFGTRRFRPALQTMLCVSVSTVAAAGLLAVSGWAGMGWLLFLAVTSPLARILLRSGRLLRGDPEQRALWDAAVLPGEDDARKDVRATASRAPGQQHGQVTAWTELPDADGLIGMDDQMICGAWRRSYVLLEAPGIGRRLEIVRLRQLYLDELIRRHPDELKRWLASGARAAGNPQPFLERPVTGQGGSSTEDSL
jgi:hypothetical protein